MNMFACGWTWTVLLFLALEAASLSAGSGTFKLRLLHTNDMHARFQQVSKSTGKCSERDAANNLCYGGFARMRTALNNEIAKAAKENITVLSLNAGDSYQGSVFYTIFKWHIVLPFLEMLPIDAMSLGNHEFDDGIEGIVPLLNQITIPVVTCNIDDSEEPEFAKTPLKKSIILEKNGMKFGIIGFLTNSTATLSNAGKLKMKDEIECLTEEATNLTNQGVKIIIAVGHSGYDVDLEIAKQVPYVDVVVGGHSHTFLYTGTPPDSDKPLNTYPIHVTQESGRKVPVVQAYAYTKYLGKLDVTFDENGEVVHAEGNPILLDHTITEDAEVLHKLKEWQEKLNITLSEVVGRSRVILDKTFCRFMECNLGNLVTDAYIHHVARNHSGPNWTPAPIAIQQGGGIRASINASGNQHMLTREDFMMSMPYYATVSVVQLQGRHLWNAMEWSVARYDPKLRVGRGEFLQMSGLKVQYDISKPPGSRVVSLKARCDVCDVPKYEALSMDKDYKLIMPTFLLRGGDNFTMFRDYAIEIFTIETLDTDVVIKYVQDMVVVYPGLEERVEFLKTSEPSSSNILRYNLTYFYVFICLMYFK